MIIDASIKNDINTMILNEPIVVLDLYAEWCVPCTKQYEIIKNVNSYFDNVKFIKINVDEFFELSQEYKVKNIPTLLFFKNGKLVKRNTGLINESVLIEIINSIKDFEE